MMWLPLVTVSLLVLGVFGDDPYLLVARYRGVDRLSLDGTGKRTVVTGSSGNHHYAMAYDYSSGLLFYSTSRPEVRRSSLTGEDDQLLVDDIYSAGLALDLRQERLYVTDYNGGKIEVMDYSGQNRQTLVTGLGRPEGLALDTDSRRMYWTEYTGHVKSASMGGSNVTMLRQGQGVRLFRGYMNEQTETSHQHSIGLNPETAAYNFVVPSESTLKKEFQKYKVQDRDPRGSGNITARDVPTALASCCAIMAKKTDPERTYHLRTSRSKRVYDQSHSHDGHDVAGVDTRMQPVSTRDVVYMWPHQFDDPASLKSNPNRKSGVISGANKPSPWVTLVREDTTKYAK